MRWSYRIALWVAFAVFAGAIFGTTFLIFYLDTGSPEAASGETPKVAGPPLKFFTLTAAAGSEPPSMKFWESSVEVGSTGRFDYWAVNTHDKPVNVSVPRKDCTCTSARIGIVDLEAYAKYQRNLAAGAFLSLAGSPGGLLWNAVGVQEFDRGIDWKPLYVDSNMSNAVVPPARGGVPQPVLLRLSWVGKPGKGAEQTIGATVMTSLPDASGSTANLSAQISVVSSFVVSAPGSRDASISFGDIARDGRRSRDILIWSATRPALDITLRLPNPNEVDPHLTWTTPQDVTDAELAALNRDLAAASENRKAEGGKPTKGSIIRARSAQKCTLTLLESVEVERGGAKEKDRLDLGPWERRLTVAQGKETHDIVLKASVRGEIRLLSGSGEIERVDFGQPFPAKQAKSKEVTILAEQPGIDLELVPDPSTPDILKVELIPLPPREGKAQWTLKVQIPAGKLVGFLPASAAVIVQTKDAAKRKIRIPVAAQTHGGPDF